MSCLVALISLAGRRLGLTSKTNSKYKALSSYIISQMCRVCVCVSVAVAVPGLSPPSLVVGRERRIPKGTMPTVPNAASTTIDDFNKPTKKLFLVGSGLSSSKQDYRPPNTLITRQTDDFINPRGNQSRQL